MNVIEIYTVSLFDFPDNDSSLKNKKTDRNMRFSLADRWTHKDFIYDK